jgi:hypothetical protein
LLLTLLWRVTVQRTLTPSNLCTLAKGDSHAGLHLVRCNFHKEASHKGLPWARGDFFNEAPAVVVHRKESTAFLWSDHCTFKLVNMSQDESRVSVLGLCSSVAGTSSELHDSSWEGGIIIVYYSKLLFIIIIANYCLLADKATASRSQYSASVKARSISKEIQHKKTLY